MKLYENFFFCRKAVKNSDLVGYRFAFLEAISQAMFFGLWTQISKVFMKKDLHFYDLPTEGFYFVPISVFIVMFGVYMILIFRERSRMKTIEK